MVVNFEMCSSLIWIQKSLEKRKLQSVCALKYKESMCQRYGESIREKNACMCGSEIECKRERKKSVRA